MLYGRLGEQERVRALLEAARDRRSGALLVVGEPGAGKSALTCIGWALQAVGLSCRSAGGLVAGVRHYAPYPR
jgi:AAA ATPase domain